MVQDERSQHKCQTGVKFDNFWPKGLDPPCFVYISKFVYKKRKTNVGKLITVPGPVILKQGGGVQSRRSRIFGVLGFFDALLHIPFAILSYLFNFFLRVKNYLHCKQCTLAVIKAYACHNLQKRTTQKKIKLGVGGGTLCTGPRSAFVFRCYKLSN